MRLDKVKRTRTDRVFMLDMDDVVVSSSTKPLQKDYETWSLKHLLLIKKFDFNVMI